MSSLSDWFVEAMWELNFDPLAARFCVLPVWLDFGWTDQLRDFVDPNGCMVLHIGRFLEVVGVDDADFASTSMGGTLQCWLRPPTLRPFRSRRMVLSSGAGFSPANDHRAVL